MKQILIILLLLSATLTSHACKCFLVSFSQEVNQSDQIFIGTVLKKTIDTKVYYLFSVSQMFKGDKTDTLTIKTGFGGGDCGMNFEIGKAYVVYSSNRETNRCRRNSLTDSSTDLGKLKYEFMRDYAAEIGKTKEPALTHQEADYLNSDLLSERKDFDFYQKKVAFALDDVFIDKQQYFENCGGKDNVSTLIVLTEDEKRKVNGYDIIVVSQTKQIITQNFRRRLIEKLKEESTY